VMIVPGLEEEHARTGADADEVLVYHEYPEQGTRGENVYSRLRPLISSSDIVGLENNIASVTFARTVDDWGRHTRDIGTEILRLRLVKDAEEIELIRVAGQLARIGIEQTLNDSQPGTSQLVAEMNGTQRLLEAGAEIVPEAMLIPFQFTTSGPETSMPHLITTTRRFESPDLVIHSRQVSVDNYRAELERTWFIGTPADEQRRYFEIMQAAQWAAIEACTPGTPMRQVDDAARSIFQRAGIGDYAIHRTGHGLGIEPHEAPYLRWDVGEPLVSGMVVSIEPGFYIPGSQGYRHSDTVAVTENGYELLTEYPRDLEAMTLGV
jgi:Xaa-Pro dipeptidase